MNLSGASKVQRIFKMFWNCFRFDFAGSLLPYNSEEISVKVGLHHHGEEPDRPGYTLDELLTLARRSDLYLESLKILVFFKLKVFCRWRYVMVGSILLGGKCSSVLEHFTAVDSIVTTSTLIIFRYTIYA